MQSKLCCLSWSVCWSQLCNLLFRAAATRMARRKRRPQLQRWRKGINLTPATVSISFLCNVFVCAMHVSKRGFCFSPLKKTKMSLVPCMESSERSHLELKFDVAEVEKVARLDALSFFFFFSLLSLRCCFVCSVTSCWPQLTVQMLSFAV